MLSTWNTHLISDPQEQAEREWRRKEKMEAEKKMIADEMMKKARTEQVQSKEHFMAVQAQRERLEFERVLTYVSW